MTDEQQFYVAQKAVIEKNGKVLVVVDPMFGIDFPGGKIQANEAKEKKDLELSLKREVKEETGLDIEVLNPFDVWFFDVLRETHKLFGRKVFVVAFRCNYVSGEVNLSKEHNNFEWVDKNSYRKFENDSNSFSTLNKYFQKN